MDPEILLIASLIAVYSCVQSVLGMGILVFGTPTLLLMGFGFAETLGSLLPSSIVISALQIARPGIVRPRMPKDLYYFCLPVIAVSLWFSIATGFTKYAILMVGIILLLSSLARSVPSFQLHLSHLIQRNAAIYHIVMGLVHGLTNLGGALLAIFAASLFPKKEEARYTIAYYYITFGLLQCATLLVTLNGGSLLVGMFLSPVAALLYIAVGSPLFKKFKDFDYSRAMSAFIFAYGAVLLGQSLL